MVAVQIGAGAVVLATALWLFAKARPLGLQPRRWLDWLWRSLLPACVLHLSSYVIEPVYTCLSLGPPVSTVVFYSLLGVAVVLAAWVAYRTNLRQLAIVGPIAFILLLALQLALALPLLILTFMLIGGI